MHPAQSKRNQIDTSLARPEPSAKLKAVLGREHSQEQGRREDQNNRDNDILVIEKELVIQHNPALPSQLKNARRARRSIGQTNSQARKPRTLTLYILMLYLLILDCRLFRVQSCLKLYAGLVYLVATVAHDEELHIDWIRVSYC